MQNDPHAGQGSSSGDGQCQCGGERPTPDPRLRPPLRAAPASDSRSQGTNNVHVE
jgi:hypothetical protein